MSNLSPEWMQAQLTKLAHDPHLCLCELSGEFHVIVDGGCELCEKGYAIRHAKAVSDADVTRSFKTYSTAVGLDDASGLLRAICARGLRAVLEQERGVDPPRAPVAKKTWDPAASPVDPATDQWSA